MRLRAATTLGAGGVEVLLQLAESATVADVWSAAAVLALAERLPIERDKTLLDRALREGDFRRAAHQAIAPIQSRLGGASPGQLSLATADAGQLSLAEAGVRSSCPHRPRRRRSCRRVPRMPRRSA
jgi:hypothetical protein